MSTKSLSPFILPACFLIVAIGALSTYWYLSSAPAKPLKPITPLVENTAPEPVEADTAPQSTVTDTPLTDNNLEEDISARDEQESNAIPIIALNDSDVEIAQDIQQLDSDNDLNLVSWLSSKELARKLVRAAYGASLGNVVTQHRPVTSPKNRFSTVRLQERGADKIQKLYRIDKSNFSHYSGYIKAFKAVNGETLTGLYQKYSPALEQAYLELGVQNTPNKDSPSSFHSTLLSAIDHFLAAPDVDDDVKLIRPSVMYHFQDPSLEKLSQAHKLMVRMGSDNRQQLKLELKKLKSNLQAIGK